MDEIDKIKKELENTKNLIKQIEDKDKISTFKQEVKENDGLLKENNLIVVNRTGHYFWIFLSLVWSIILIGTIIYGFYLFNNTDFNLDGLIHPNFNNSVDIKNNYQFNSSSNTNNQYTHTVDSRDYNNVTVNIKICNLNQTC